jgi:hypothetical protein
MFTFILMACVLDTIVLIGATIRAVQRHDRASKEINREGADFLARWGR